MLKKQLEILGYSDKEANVFLLINKIGPSPASTLARLANIKRTTIYDILNSLIKKNVIISYKQDIYTYYAIDDIYKLFLHEKEKLSVAQKLTEELKQSQAQGLGIQIYHYKGKTGFVEMYEDILKTSNLKEVLIWVNYENFLNVVDQEKDLDWTLRRVKKGVKARILMQSSQTGRDFKIDDSKYKRQTKLISQNNPFKTTCILFENHIAFFDPSDSMTGIRIFNPDLYKMQKQIFEMNWAFID